MAGHGEALQDLNQVLLAKLGRSTGAVRQVGQADFAGGHPAVPPLKLALDMSRDLFYLLMMLIAKDT